MRSLLLAIQFLTIIPLKVKGATEREIASATTYFPLVGLFLGFLLCAVNALLGLFNLPAFTVNIILVACLIAITGGMHLDGLSDTADAFLSARSREEMLAIMRDPHIGVMGVISILSIILLKIGLLTAVATSLKTTALLLACILSRWSVVLAMFLFPYARKEGKAKVFIQGMNVRIFLFSLITVFICALFIWSLRGFLIVAIVAGCTYLNNKFVTKKIGGITGDTLGASIEVTELVTLFTICIS